MKIVRVTLLALGLASLAAACGGKNKTADTTMENKGGDMAASGSGSATGSGTGGDMYGGGMYGGGGDMGGGGNPCGD